MENELYDGNCDRTNILTYQGFYLMEYALVLPY